MLGIDYSLARLIVLVLGVWSALSLWLWLYRTRTGMVIRAGVDDRQMTSALGVNIQVDVRDRLRRRLGARGVRRRRSAPPRAACASGQDGQWLLNSLVVVIIGGMGSLARRRRRLAPLRARLLVLGRRTCRRPATTAARSTRSCSRSCCSRSCSPSGRRGCSGRLGDERSLRRRRRIVERVIGARRARRRRARPGRLQRLLGRATILTADVPPRDRRGEPHLPLRLRRHDLARADGADGDRRLTCSATWSRTAGRRVEGPHPRLGSDAGARARDRDHHADRARSSARSPRGASASTS